jgi:hypothetical protein
VSKLGKGVLELDLQPKTSYAAVGRKANASDRIGDQIEVDRRLAEHAETRSEDVRKPKIDRLVSEI